MPARCPQHGLAIAPDGKCVRCRREEAERAQPEPIDMPKPVARARTAAAAIALAMIALAIAGVVWRRSATSGGAAPAASVPPSATSAHAPIDAAAPPLLPLVSVKLPPDPEPTAPAASAKDERLARAMRDVPITMYSKRGDANCERARAWLFANGYVYTDRDVEHDTEAAQARSALTGNNDVPVLDVGGQALVGFDPVRVTRALEYAAAKRLQR
jgi:glutaredoxin